MVEMHLQKVLPSKGSSMTKTFIAKRQMPRKMITIKILKYVQWMANFERCLFRWNSAISKLAATIIELYIQPLVAFVVFNACADCDGIGYLGDLHCMFAA